MNLEERQQWERTRAAGYDKYLLSTIAREGVPEGILGTLLIMLIHYLGHRLAGRWLDDLTGLGVLILGIGWIRAAESWRKNESEYLKPEGSGESAIGQASNAAR